MLRKFVPLFLLFFVLISTPVFSSSTNDNQKYYTILLKSNENWEEALEKIKLLNGTITYTVPEIGLVQIKSNDSVINKIKTNHLSIIDSLNPSIQIEQSILKPFSTMSVDKLNINNTTSSLWDLQWDMKDVTQNGKSYNIETGSHKVVVGIVDSGIDTDHQDLRSNILENSINFVPKGGFRETEPLETGELSNVEDLMGHGTMVAGTIAANGEMKGVAPNIAIKSYRVFGNKSAEAIWIIKAIIQAANDNIDVINLSLGSYYIKGEILTNGELSENNFAEVKAYQKAIKYANKSGSIVVASAGNDSINIADKKELSNFLAGELSEEGQTFKGKAYAIPGELNDVITVSSTGPTEELSTFSNYGKGYIDISAPGGDSRLLEEVGYDRWWNEGIFREEAVMTTYNNGRYTFSLGTSLAAPKVSAALALIIEKYNYKDKPNKTINHLYKYGIKNNMNNKDYWGNGQLDVYKALMK
mgnify:CR=1 FL=1